ncbi:MAG: hypothetical protein OJF49_001455 [Ktedonobacterales bacterium]|nr:MAG: hypothetical protein OJF49_001455 [Ktedonobacterales bacterium]
MWTALACECLTPTLPRWRTGVTYRSPSITRITHACHTRISPRHLTSPSHLAISPAQS